MAWKLAIVGKLKDLADIDRASELTKALSIMAFMIGRSGRVRTRDLRFWRPKLQLHRTPLLSIKPTID